MPGDLPYSRLPAVPYLSPLRLIPHRVKRGLKQLGHTLHHTLRLSSSGLLLMHVPPSHYSRRVPSAWGSRRDYYHWSHRHRDDIAEFLEAAASVANVLVHRPIAAWADLLPGAMDAVIGNSSDLYLADYWTFTLHHLVWSGKLPYAVNARWERGNSMEDDPFVFVSELPTDLAEASREALILFEECAAREITNTVSFIEQFTHPIDLRPYGLPIYDDGQWRLPPRRDANVILQSVDDVVAKQTERASELSDQSNLSYEVLTAKNEPTTGSAIKAEMKAAESGAHDNTPPILDDQSFTVRHGEGCHRFSARNKQLFALLERICRRPGHRVLFNDLRSIGDVWNGAFIEDSTIRGAIARLRSILRRHRMKTLAERITTGTYRGDRYVVLHLNTEPED